MTANLPFVFGGGVTTNYTGPAVAEPYDMPVVTAQIPYVDLANQKINYRTVNFAIFRSSLGGFELYQWLELMWENVVNEFSIADLPDRALAVTTTLVPGKNESRDTSVWANMHSFEITLNADAAPNIDKWWGDDDMGKYGYFNPMVNSFSKIMPMTWINSQVSLIRNENKEANGWSAYLFPNVYGAITGYGRLLPEPIIYSGTYSGRYPA